MRLLPPFRFPGGKYYCAPWIISQFPKDFNAYVEPFCGAANVFFAKQESENEVLGDLDSSIIEILQLLKEGWGDLYEWLRNLEYSECTFQTAKIGLLPFSLDLVNTRAANALVTRRMSRCGQGQAFSWCERLRGGQPSEINAWNNFVRRVPEIGRRLKNTIVVQSHAFTLLDAYASSSTLFYIDPPYYGPSRSSSTKLYLHNFESEEEHIALVEKIRDMDGFFMLSGYNHPLYADILCGWKKSYLERPNNMGVGEKKGVKREVLWRNF